RAKAFSNSFVAAIVKKPICRFATATIRRTKHLAPISRCMKKRSTAVGLAGPLNCLPANLRLRLLFQRARMARAICEWPLATRHRTHSGRPISMYGKRPTTSPVRRHQLSQVGNNVFDDFLPAFHVGALLGNA